MAIIPAQTYATGPTKTLDSGPSDANIFLSSLINSFAQNQALKSSNQQKNQQLMMSSVLPAFINQGMATYNGQPMDYSNPMSSFTINQKPKADVHGMLKNQKLAEEITKLRTDNAQSPARKTFDSLLKSAMQGMLPMMEPDEQVQKVNEMWDLSQKIEDFMNPTTTKRDSKAKNDIDMQVATYLKEHGYSDTPENIALFKKNNPDWKGE